MKIFLTFWFLLSVFMTFSQVERVYVHPYNTDSNFALLQDSHLVVRNPNTQVNKLFLFIGGSYSNPKAYITISNFVGNLGYDVLNISYPNNVPAASLANDIDSLVFDKYRDEICYGTPGSNAVSVDSLQSIYSRTLKLLTFLIDSFPTQNWDQYLINSTTIDWSKIVVSGHSQGSGHAAYFAKVNSVERILMFSGPNDYSQHFSSSAKWLKEVGQTDVNRYFSYLCLLDEVIDYDIQYQNLQALGMYPLFDTTHVDLFAAPYNNSHCLYTSQIPGLAIQYHNSPIKYSSLNQEVWTYMLETEIISAIHELNKVENYTVFPNPANSMITIRSSESFKDDSYKIFSGNGQLLKTQKIKDSNTLKIDVSEYDNGFYFIEIDNQWIKTMKY